MNLSKTYNQLTTVSLNDAFKALLLSFVIGASSILAFKLPFMSVPWVLQNQIVLVIGYLFGARVGFLSTLFFVIEGALGAPVFANGTSGMAVLMGPTGGYLLGYPVASFMAGFLKDHLPRSPLGAFLSFLVSHFVIYGFGVTALATMIGLKNAILLGFVPFIALDVIKSFVSSYLVFSKK